MLSVPNEGDSPALSCLPFSPRVMRVKELCCHKSRNRGENRLVLARGQEVSRGENRVYNPILLLNYYLMGPKEVCHNVLVYIAMPGKWCCLHSRWPWPLPSFPHLSSWFCLLGTFNSQVAMSFPRMFTGVQWHCTCMLSCACTAPCTLVDGQGEAFTTEATYMGLS